MSRTFRIQPSAHVDHITKDGTELTKLPYPFFVDERGFIGRQDVWMGKHVQVIGFAEDLSVHEIDLTWQEAVEDPDAAVGMYLVTSDDEGDWYMHDNAVALCEELPEDGR